MVLTEILKVREDVCEEVSKRVGLNETTSRMEHVKEMEVIYMNRVQKDRFADLAEYEKVKGSYRLTTEELSKAKKSSIVMHPLPRVDEVDPAIDATSHAKYFQQVGYGVVLRMALLGLLLGAV